MPQAQISTFIERSITGRLSSVTQNTIFTRPFLTSQSLVKLFFFWQSLELELWILKVEQLYFCSPVVVSVNGVGYFSLLLLILE